MAGQAQKTEAKKTEFYPSQLDWFAANGIDARLALTSVNRHVQAAEDYGKVLRRKSLKVCQNEMDGYLREYRAAESELRDLAARLSDPKTKAKFLSENKNFTSHDYDSLVEGLRRRASAFQKLAWSYEKAYAEKYGPRSEYQSHLLVREIARQIREELEKKAGSPYPVYRRGSERAYVARNERPETVSGETHALVSSFMQELDRKYGEEDRSGYRRGYERAGKKYLEIASLERNTPSKYKRGERKILDEREKIMIARRSVPAKTDAEETARIARISTLRARTPLEETQAGIERVKKERAELKDRMASLSGAERRKASEDLLELNKELYKLRKYRDSMV